MTIAYKEYCIYKTLGVKLLSRSIKALLTKNHIDLVEYNKLKAIHSNAFGYPNYSNNSELLLINLIYKILVVKGLIKPQ